MIDRKGLRKEVESLLEVIISYISICCGGDTEEEDECDGLSSCFADVIRVWALDKFRRDMRGFFPVISDGVCEGIRGGCGLGFLAGIVMCEAFVLRLCLKFDSRVLRAELERDVHDWVVRMISGFKSFHFLGKHLHFLGWCHLRLSVVLSFD